LPAASFNLPGFKQASACALAEARPGCRSGPANAPSGGLDLRPIGRGSLAKPIRTIGVVSETTQFQSTRLTQGPRSNIPNLSQPWLLGEAEGARAKG